MGQVMMELQETGSISLEAIRRIVALFAPLISSSTMEGPMEGLSNHITPPIFMMRIAIVGL